MDTETLNDKSNKNKTAQIIATAAVVLACVIVAGLLPSIKMPMFRIGFGFVPLLIGSMLLPIPYTVIIAILGDLIKYFLFNASFGPLNIGITIGAGVAGLIYGVAFSKVSQPDFKFTKKFIIKAVIACFCVILFADIIINTFALSIQMGKGFWLILFPTRLISETIMFALHIPIVLMIAKIIAKFRENK